MVSAIELEYPVEGDGGFFGGVEVLMVVIVGGAIFLFYYLIFPKTGRYSGFTLPDGLSKWPPPCGEVCSYKGTEQKSKLKTYKQLHKSIDCTNILGRMAWDKYDISYPPPEEPPKEMLEEFTQNGFMPLVKGKYHVNFPPHKSKRVSVFNRDVVENLQIKEANGGSISTYRIGRILSNALRDHNKYIQGKRGLVIGSRRPWVEVTVLNNGAEHVTTLEYGNIQFLHPKLSVFHPVSFAQKFLTEGIEPFDFGVTFSSLEHSGLGRYGDPINPYGDLEAMAQAWCLIKPGGFFLLGLPCTDDMTDPTGSIVWNGHRIYGLARLAHMTANWELLKVWDTETKHKIFGLERL